MADRCVNGTIILRMRSPAGRQMLHDMYKEENLWLRGRQVMTQAIIEVPEFTAIILLDHLTYLAELGRALHKKGD